MNKHLKELCFSLKTIYGKTVIKILLPSLLLPTAFADTALPCHTDSPAIADRAICAQKNTDYLARQINQNSRKLAQLDRSTAEKFTASQKLWVDFVQADCRFESEPSRDSMGSGYGYVYHSCMQRKYLERYHQVGQIIRHLSNEEPSSAVTK